MDAGLFPSSINAAVSHSIKHKHTFILELGPSTLNFGKEAGRALIAVTAIVAITSIIKTFISRPVIVQQAPFPPGFLEQVSKERERKQKKESASKRDGSSESTITAAAATPTGTATPAADENAAKETSAPTPATA